MSCMDSQPVATQRYRFPRQTLGAYPPHLSLTHTSLLSPRPLQIRFRWQTLCLRAGYEAIVPAVVSFITEQGRMKVRVL